MSSSFVGAGVGAGVSVGVGNGTGAGVRVGAGAGAGVVFFFLTSRSPLLAFDTCISQSQCHQFYHLRVIFVLLDGRN